LRPELLLLDNCVITYTLLQFRLDFGHLKLRGEGARCNFFP
jgi:hypothetical protein